MNLHWIDWTINGIFVAGMIAAALFTRGYMRSVADFLAANRLAGRYLLTVAGGLGGAISMVATWEMIYAAGFPTQWWSLMALPVALILTLTAFATYRFRQTRAFTLAQFLEIRYSRNFRIFAGSLCFVSGILNFGVFPAVTAHFMIHFFGLPASISLGPLEVGTFPVVMLAELSLALFLTLCGGQITILITEFYQGMLTMIMFVILLAFLMLSISWNDIIAGLQFAPEARSMIDPFQTQAVQDFNIWYFAIAILASVYNVKSWQGASAYNSAPRTPHEAQMAGILTGWKSTVQALLMLIVPLAAYAVMHNPKFVDLAQPITATINTIGDPATRTQMIVPIVLTHLLPVGLMGLFAAVIIASAINTDETYLHSWGTIFVQDVVVPLWGKPLSPSAHLMLLRGAIVAVAAFGFAFSMLFTLRDYIFMYFNLTGAIFLGGAGSVILGGLYWKRGTTPAAWVAMLMGSSLAFGGLLIQQAWAGTLAPLLLDWFPESGFLHTHKAKFPVNGTMIYFYAMVFSVSAYVTVSLFGPRKIFDMDKMLHRGVHAVASDQVIEASPAKKNLGTLLGITPEFTRRDRLIFWGTFWWQMGLWLIFLGGTIAGAFFISIPIAAWTGFWFVKIWVSFVLGIGITIWFVWGGCVDAFRLFRDLRTARIDQSDDGLVTNREMAHYHKPDGLPRDK